MAGNMVLRLQERDRYKPHLRLVGGRDSVARAPESDCWPDNAQEDFPSLSPEVMRCNSAGRVLAEFAAVLAVIRALMLFTHLFV